MIDDPGCYDAGIPRGTADLALRLAGRAAETASRLTGMTYEVDEHAVLAHLLLPLVAGDPPVPAAPRAMPGGWVHADLLPEDEDLFAVVTRDAPDAESAAALAQECRLPVTPYRTAAAAASEASSWQEPLRRVDPAEITVVDLTAMWSGPLATMLLAAWGARVLTVEPPVRRDGLRGSPAQFAVLDRGKDRAPWDLRHDEDRVAFEDAVRAADVLVESFSARVMPNLGYATEDLWRLNPRLAVLAVRAFPRGTAEASWVAYGRGVHAASGLGMVDGVPQPAVVAYPDPLAGLTAFDAVLAALGQTGPRQVDVSLAGAVTPLLSSAGTPLGRIDDDAIARLRDASGGRPGAVILPVRA